MALSDKLPWLKLSREDTRPKTGGQLLVHFLLSLALLATSLGLMYLVVVSDTRRTLSCDGTHCVVRERSGMFAKPMRLAKMTQPVSFEVRPRQFGTLAVLMIDAEGESDWVSPANAAPEDVRRVARELATWPQGKDYVIDVDGFGLEWQALCLLLLLTSAINLRNSVRWFLQMR